MFWLSNCPFIFCGFAVLLLFSCFSCSLFRWRSSGSRGTKWKWELLRHCMNGFSFRDFCYLCRCCLHGYVIVQFVVCMCGLHELFLVGFKDYSNFEFHFTIWKALRHNYHHLLKVTVDVVRECLCKMFRWPCRNVSARVGASEIGKFWIWIFAAGDVSISKSLVNGSGKGRGLWNSHN